jgi:hypothetical protein
MLERSPGSCPVYLDVRDAAGKRLGLKLGEEYCINPATVATAELEMVLGPNQVYFSGLGNGRGGT